MARSDMVVCSASGLAVMALAMAALPAWALYKVVGPDGKVTYTDRAPADRPAQSLSATGAVSSTASLPFELRQVSSKYPVTLYTTNDCTICDQGRNSLKRRGIPFAEKTVVTPADVQALQRLEGTQQLPLLRVGKQQVLGFLDAEWQSYLDAAGYPAQSALPPSYQWPEPSPLAPPTTTASKPADSRPNRPSAPPPRSDAPPAATPPGFRF